MSLRILSSLLIPALLCFASLAAADEPTWAPGEHTITVRTGNLDRTCLLHVPPAASRNAPLPLVLAFHGSGGTGRSMQKMTGFDALADRFGFIAAYPDGLRETKTWNTLYGDAPEGTGILAKADDLGFLRALLKRLKETEKIEPSRIYACGFSAGAYMAYRLAMEMPDQLAAVGPVCGSLGVKCIDGKPTLDSPPEPRAPDSVIHIRGLLDRNVKLEGGGGQKARFISTAECIARFVKVNGDTAAPRTTTDAANGVTRTLYTGSPDGREVELIVVDRTAHEWPTLAKGLPASEALWEFFAAHPRPPDVGRR